MSKYLYHNGELQLANEYALKADNRCFSYGDGLFETIRCQNSKPLFFDKHFLRLAHSLDMLKIVLPGEYSQKFFEGAIYRLLQRNRLYKGARVRITAYRNAGGLYTPTNNTMGFVITASSIDSEIYTLSRKGLTINIYTEQQKPANKFSSLKTCNSLLFVMAGLWKKENNLDDCLIVNSAGKIIEGLSSNIFVVKDNTLYTPNLKSGCVKGTMRSTILEIAEVNGMKIEFNNGFAEAELLNADEVFLTNAIQGVSHVSGFRSKRYYHKTSASFSAELNELQKRQLG